MVNEGRRGGEERKSVDLYSFRHNARCRWIQGVRMRGNGRENAGRNNRGPRPPSSHPRYRWHCDVPRRTRKKLDFNRTFAIELLPGSIATLRSLVSAGSQIFVRETRAEGTARGKPIWYRAKKNQSTLNKFPTVSDCIEIRQIFPNNFQLYI